MNESDGGQVGGSLPRIEGANQTVDYRPTDYHLKPD